MAFGARGYFRQPWNVFDFVLVVGTSVGPAVGLPSVTSLLRVFRVLRAVRLVRGSKGMVQVRELAMEGGVCCVRAILGGQSRVVCFVH